MRPLLNTRLSRFWSGLLALIISLRLLRSFWILLIARRSFTAVCGGNFDVVVGELGILLLSYIVNMLLLSDAIYSRSLVNIIFGSYSEIL
jgi:hypothetical protein